jgi:cyclopropane fatty-acyl-phospholipid synthase-like methyltransferase
VKVREFMRNPAISKSAEAVGNAHERAEQYKRDFWGKENLTFNEPWYRLVKAARIISKLAGGAERSLLDVGCGPAALMRLMPPNISYYGIDIAIKEPAPNLLEADIANTPIDFNGKRFDIVSALGIFEYIGDSQSRKFGEIARVLADGGKFLVTYTNFSHRRTRIYEAFSNIQPLGAFRADLENYFTIDRSFPASHNWKQAQPNRELVKQVNMRVNANIPLISQRLAVDYFFICTPRGNV